MTTDASDTIRYATEESSYRVEEAEVGITETEEEADDTAAIHEAATQEDPEFGGEHVISSFLYDVLLLS